MMKTKKNGLPWLMKRLRRGLSESQERVEWSSFVSDHGDEFAPEEIESLYVSMRVEPTGKAGHPFKPERIIKAMGSL